jgi:hypothetical protein
MLKSIKTSSVKCRRRFDETFKREAVQNWLASGKSAAVVGEELGITANLLYDWVAADYPSWTWTALAAARAREDGWFIAAWSADGTLDTVAYCSDCATKTH